MRICNPVSVLVQAVTLRDNIHQGSGLKKYSKENPPHPTLINPVFQHSGDERHPHHLSSSKHRWRGPLGLKQECWEYVGMDPTGIDLISAPGPKKNYFTSSDPHHDMLGGGCQVRVVIENMMGRMENLKTLISGFLGLVILVRWALVTMFLS